MLEILFGCLPTASLSGRPGTGSKLIRSVRARSARGPAGELNDLLENKENNVRRFITAQQFPVFVSESFF